MTVGVRGGRRGGTHKVSICVLEVCDCTWWHIVVGTFEIFTGLTVAEEKSA